MVRVVDCDGLRLATGDTMALEIGSTWPNGTAALRYLLCVVKMRACRDRVTTARNDVASSKDAVSVPAAKSGSVTTTGDVLVDRYAIVGKASLFQGAWTDVVRRSCSPSDRHQLHSAGS
jgi:hypothetical protein